MADPWLSLIGIGEDGLNGLTPASRTALEAADFVFGAPRHLALAKVSGHRARAWPVPFDTAPVLALRGQSVAVLASGDPFWFGAGGSLARDLSPGEWVAHPAASTFSLIAARLGWRLETVACLGLHAAPLAELRPHAQKGQRLILLLAGPEAVSPAVDLLSGWGFPASSFWLAEAMSGPRERLRAFAADAVPDDAMAPLALAVHLQGGPGLACASGLDDALFVHDGQITKRPFRALALSALAPRPGETLWDIGAGSGSISVEWCLAGGRSLAIEPRADRQATIAANAVAFGVTARLTVLPGAAPECLEPLPDPDAVFVGGGASEALLAALWSRLRPGTRIVAHAVTLETEALLLTWHKAKGGALLKIDLAHPAPLGAMTGWQPMRPILQWQVQT